MSSPEVRCECGAINDVAFDSCIRCGQKLGPVRVASGDRVRVAPPREAPPQLAGPGTSVLLLGGLCAVVFAMQVAFELKAGGSVPILGGDRIAALRAGVLITTDDLIRLEPFRFLSAVYVHFGLIHFGLNMLGLYSQGRLADHILGSARTMIAFVVGGVVGFVATWLVQLLLGAPASVTAGASGGLLAVMGLILGVMRRRKMPGFATQAGNVLFYVVMFGFAVNFTQSSIAINNTAHIAGLIVGFGLGYVWGESRDAGGPVTRGAAVVLFLASVASIVLALSSNLHELVGTTGTRQ